MGFLDKLKKTVMAVKAPGLDHAPDDASQPAAPSHEPESETGSDAISGPSFVWDGEAYPIPEGWNGLSLEDWFFKYETVRDRLRYIDNEQLPQMEDDSLDPEEILLITQYGFTSGGHYEAYRNWAVHGWAQELGMSPTDCEFKMGTILRDRIMAAKASAISGPGGALSDVEGVSCSQWAQLQARIAGGAEPTALIAEAGIDSDRWARVSAEWNQRMSTDTSGAIATTYANAFASAAVGPYGTHSAQAASAGVGGDVGDEPVPFETFVEITEAQSAAADRGEDPIALLAQFGMRPVDWSNIGMYWNRRLAQEATKYHDLYTELSARYAAKYGNGDGLTNDEREEMILGKILEMARAGQAAEVLPFLRKYFPDDADDADALDWWIDKACDMCGEAGDRGLAEQLLIVRYSLQEDESEPMQAWVASRLESL